VDLVNETTVYQSAIKSYLVAQAQVAGVDFSNSTFFPTAGLPGNSDFVWAWAIWVLKLIRAYDFVGRENFTGGEQTIIEGWFRDAADWHSYLCNEKGFDQLYTTRGGPTEDYTFDMNGEDDPIFRNGPIKWQAGSWHSNRRWGQVSFVTHVGVMLDDTAFKQTGSYAFKEWLSFHLYETGYAMELDRSTTAAPWRGLGYTPSTTANVAGVARVLYLNEFENLFDYTTDTHLVSATGGITETPDLNKSLSWAIIQQFRENFLESDADDIYPYGSTGTSTDILIHYCDATPDSNQTKHRVKPGEPASIANVYYDDNAIRGVYWADETLCGYPSSPSTQGIFLAWNGTDGQYPAYMFMYADLETDPTPPVPPEPYIRKAGRGQLPFNSKYITP